VRVFVRVARFVLVQQTKMGKIYQNGYINTKKLQKYQTAKKYKMATQIPHDHKTTQNGN
jgi:hypothetical protein